MPELQAWVATKIKSIVYAWHSHKLSFSAFKKKKKGVLSFVSG